MRALSGAVTVFVLSLALPLQGQVGPDGRGVRGQRPMQGGPAMEEGRGMHGGEGMTDHQMVGIGIANRVLWLKEDLSLTDDQVESLKDVDSDAQRAQQAARLQMIGMRNQLRDDEITRGQFLDLMTAHRDGMMQQGAALQERVDNILSDVQKDQLDAIRARGDRGQGMRGPRGEGMRRGRGARGGRGMGPAAGSGRRGPGSRFDGRRGPGPA